MENIIFRWRRRQAKALTRNTEVGFPCDGETLSGNFLGINFATWIAMALAIIALILRLWHINYGLPILYNVDESFIVPKVVRFGTGDFNPHIFMWPHFFFYLLFMLYGGFYAIGRVLDVFQGLEQFQYLYFNDPSVFYIIGRVASATAGAATVLMLYYLGKHGHSKNGGLLAAGFLSVFHFHFVYSRLALPEVTMTLLVVLAAYNALRIYKDGRVKNYLLAGIFAGLAVSTKYNAFLIFVTVVLGHFFFIHREFGWKMMHRNLGRLLLVAVISLLAFLAGTPFALLEHRIFLKDIAFTALVHTYYYLSTGFVTSVLGYIRIFFFPDWWFRELNFIGVFIVAGTILAFVRHRKQDMLLLSFPILHLLFFAEKTRSLPTPHYFMPMLPFFVLLGAMFCIDAIEWIFRKIYSKTSIGIQKIKVGLPLLFCLPGLFFIFNNNLRTEADTANLARKWVEANIPAGSRILYADYHDLHLKRNVESLKEYYGTSQQIPKERLAAIENDHQPTYFITELHHGWLDEARRSSMQNLNYLPQGVIPVDYEKLSLRFWLDRKFQYAIVFRDAIDRYLVGGDGDQFPAFREFYTELLEKATLIKEFKPSPPKITGFHVQILKLDHLGN